MKSFDAFGRPVQEFQVKTTIGGYLSLCSLASIVVLFFSELHYFCQWETRDHMVIDQHQDQKNVTITLEATFPTAPCSVLGVNLIDQKRANVMHVQTEIFKTRLTAAGVQIGAKLRDSLVNVAQNAEQVRNARGVASSVRTSHATSHLRCPSCFESRDDEDDCCSSCEEVRAEFRKRWPSGGPAGDYVFGQCADELYRKPPQAVEGCQLEISLHVNKVPAAMHIGVPKNIPEAWLPSSDWQSVGSRVDFSHKIKRLAFGPDFPGLVHVLDDHEKKIARAQDMAHFQYNVHVIPTTFAEDGREPIVSHQYSVLEFDKVVSEKSSKTDHMAPGIWMEYDFTPFEVKVTKSRKSMWHFLTVCCAILGGVFAFSGMLDNFVYQFTSRVGRKGGDIQLVSQ